ncbi:MAG TPA: DDE-type integrase/transposase/recombinase, partial [Amoebophilaceae bacterium]|nr:DDE-type integrase/transposase/recombinase [Amoebophilaceae bacterium]
KAYYAGIPVEGQDEDWESIPILERERAPSPPAPPRPTPILTPEAAMDPKEHRLLHWTGCFINPCPIHDSEKAYILKPPRFTKCSYCHKHNHNITTCPQKNKDKWMAYWTDNQQGSENASSSSSSTNSIPTTIQPLKPMPPAPTPPPVSLSFSADAPNHEAPTQPLFRNEYGTGYDTLSDSTMEAGARKENLEETGTIPVIEHLPELITTFVKWDEKIVEAYMDDPKLCWEFHDPTPGKYWKQGNVLYHKVGEKWRIAVPCNYKVQALGIELEEFLVQSAHRATGHGGAVRTWEFLKDCFTWKGMYQYVQKYVESCDLCQKVKPSTQAPAGLIHPLPIPKRPWVSICCDFLSMPPVWHKGRQYDNLWVVMDRLSSETKLIPTWKEVRAPELGDLFLEQIYRHKGLPQEIVSDRDPKFTSAWWTAFCDKLGMHQSMSSAYHPQTDGQTERTNRTLLGICRAMLLEGKTNWVENIVSIEIALNRSKNASLGVSPFTVVYGFDPVFADELATLAPTKVPAVEDRILHLLQGHQKARTALTKARMQQAHQANKRRRVAPMHKPGHQVLLSTTNLPLATSYPKFAPNFIGPFEVLRAWPQTDNYELALPEELSSIHPVFHSSLLKPYHANDDKLFPGRANLQPGPLPEFEDERWSISGILDYRTNRTTGKREFLVGWKGWDQKYDSWEPEENLDQDDVKEYLEKRGDVGPAKKTRGRKGAKKGKAPMRRNIGSFHYGGKTYLFKNGKMIHD